MTPWLARVLELSLYFLKLVGGFSAVSVVDGVMIVSLVDGVIVLDVMVAGLMVVVVDVVEVAGCRVAAPDRHQMKSHQSFTVKAEIIMRKKFVRICTSRRPVYNLKCALILLNNYCITYYLVAARALRTVRPHPHVCVCRSTCS